MDRTEEFLSPDGVLRLLVIREFDDITIGFDGFPWHTHGEVVAGELYFHGEGELSPEEATERLVSDVTTNQIPVAIEREGEHILDVWASYLLTTEDKHRPSGVVLELRTWGGKPWVAS